MTTSLKSSFKEAAGKKLLNRIFFAVLIFSSLLSEAFCQTYNIIGSVSTGSGPVKYSSITFTDNNDTSKKYITLTDENGGYQLNIVITKTDEDYHTMPQSFELGQNYPNPFSSETSIPYKLNKQSNVSVRIYNILGQEVREYKVGIQGNGIHGINWDGRNNLGSKVAAGVYLYRLQTEGESLVKKMVYIKNGSANSSGKNLNLFATVPMNNLIVESVKIENKVNEPLTFTVSIENTDSTEPKILSYELTNVILQNDTTINFQVQEAGQWKLLGLENETVTAIAVDPVDPNVIYAGTKYDYSEGIDGKLFKSIDGGETWDTLLVGGAYRSILIDPTNHNVIYALPGSIIKSEDGGATWNLIIDGIHLDLETRLMSLAMNPKNPKVLYAGTGGFYGGTMYKSYDGGLHWNEIGDDSLGDGVVSIAIDPVDTNNVYTGTAWRCILWKSTDAGTTWFRSGLGERGGIIDMVEVNPKHSNIVYAGVRFEGLFISSDSGETWTKEGLPDSVTSCVDLEFDPSNEFNIYAASYGVFNQKCKDCLWQEINERISDNPSVNVLALTKDGKNLYAGRSKLWGKSGGIFIRYLITDINK